jgi:hypothetical protein
MKILIIVDNNRSVAQLFKEHHLEVVSLDHDIMTWDYKTYEPKYFDIIIAVPPRKLKQSNEEVARITEIIDYLEPRQYFIDKTSLQQLKSLLRDKKRRVQITNYSTDLDFDNPP